MNQPALDYLRAHPLTGKTATNRFLREASEPLFNYLMMLAGDYFTLRWKYAGPDGKSVVPTNEVPELAALAEELWRAEGSQMPIEEAESACGLLAMMVIIEDLRRQGDFSWVDRYTLLSGRVPATLKAVEVDADEKQIRKYPSL
jgi:hypothetical protein